jgi:NADPH:quinone reductase-like Zn-dependent oxidoreductase
MALSLALKYELIIRFPWKIGYDLSGVSKFKPGDEVYALAGDEHRGSIAEYCLSSASKTAFKPQSLSFVEAASLPAVGTAALQAFERAETQVEGGSLKGKTVFVPGGLSGTGSVGVQIARNGFGAGKVVTTLSTAKILRAKELFGEGVLDQVVDYTKGDVVGKVGRGEVGKGEVDFMFDTVQNSLSALGTMKKGCVIVSISTMPSGSDMKRNHADMGIWLVWMPNVVDWVYLTWIGRKGVKYSYLVGSGSGEALEKLAAWVEGGKLRLVVGRKAKWKTLRK